MDGADALMDRLTTEEAVLADKAYNPEGLGDTLEKNGCTAMIPPQKNCLAPSDENAHLDQSRYLIENFFAKLKKYPSIAIRYDKTAQNFLGAIHLASSVVWLH